MPEGHERLLTHIRKAKVKARKKHDDARSVKSGEGKAARSTASHTKTARRSEWRESVLGTLHACAPTPHTNSDAQVASS